MNQLTKEQWASIAKDLESMYSAVYLRCDGYLVSACLSRVDKNKLAIVVHVNGYIRGKWITHVDSPDQFEEEPRRFYCHRKRQKMSAKELKLWEKVFGKRECKKRGYYDPFYISTPTWTSANSFIRHIRKHNQNIEVLGLETYHKEVAALIDLGAEDA